MKRHFHFDGKFTGIIHLIQYEEHERRKNYITFNRTVGGYNIHNKLMLLSIIRYHGIVINFPFMRVLYNKTDLVYCQSSQHLIIVMK